VTIIHDGRSPSQLTPDPLPATSKPGGAGKSVRLSGGLATRGSRSAIVDIQSVVDGLTDTCTVALIWSDFFASHPRRSPGGAEMDTRGLEFDGGFLSGPTSSGGKEPVVDGNPRFSVPCLPASTVESRKHAVLASAGEQESRKPVNHAQVVDATGFGETNWRQMSQIAVNLIQSPKSKVEGPKLWSNVQATTPVSAPASDAAK
jgi:hypothetical protein